MLIIAGITWYLNAESQAAQEGALRPQAKASAKSADDVDTGGAGDDDGERGCELV